MGADKKVPRLWIPNVKLICLGIILAYIIHSHSDYSTVFPETLWVGQDLTGHDFASCFPAKARKRKKTLRGVDGRNKEEESIPVEREKELCRAGHMGRSRNNSEGIRSKKCREGGRGWKRKDKSGWNWPVLGATWQTLSSLLEKSQLNILGRTKECQRQTERKQTWMQDEPKRVRWVRASFKTCGTEIWYFVPQCLKRVFFFGFPIANWILRCPLKTFSLIRVKYIILYWSQYAEALNQSPHCPTSRLCCVTSAPLFVSYPLGHRVLAFSSPLAMPLTFL